MRLGPKNEWFTTGSEYRYALGIKIGKSWQYYTGIESTPKTSGLHTTFGNIDSDRLKYWSSRKEADSIRRSLFKAFKEKWLVVRVLSHHTVEILRK